MRKSIRNIATASLMVGLLSFSTVTIQQIAKYCADGQSACLAAAVSFGVSSVEIPLTNISTDQSGSTPVSSEASSMRGFIITLVQVTSVYLILISVIVLVVLEALELRYLRKLVHAR